MRVLTLRQPWAWMVVAGIKTIETRTWRTNYRGLVVIHASKKFGNEEKETIYRMARWSEFLNNALRSAIFDTGAIIGEANLEACFRFNNFETFETLQEKHCCIPVEDYSWANRWGWELSLAKKYKQPIPIKGKLGLWDLSPDDFIAACRRAGIGSLF